MLLFFIVPLFTSVWYSFSDVKIEPGEVIVNFVGLKNYRQILLIDADYIDQLSGSVGYVLGSVPLVIAFSLIIAVLLSKKFFGRTFFRALYFSPIIFVTSAVMKILEEKPINIPIYSSNEELTDFLQLFSFMDLPPAVLSVMTFMVSFSLYVMQNAAVPIVLFLAGLQEIPAALYEVSKIEGADKWEEFWMITIPSLRNIITLVVVYTMIDLFAQSHNTVVSRAQDLMTTQDFGTSSAMLWFYFLIVIAAIGIVYSLYYRFCVKKWE
ncbi:MAG: sugar ABC transporter permease [Clostridia bacterium]|nr:sugar ABC transporter permease [Clostridia bacterium]